MFLDINVLQSVPSSNINRDDTGAPKTAIYGGVLRSRVSSQAWKRAVRKAFAHDNEQYENEMGNDWLAGIRTKDIPIMLAQEIVKQDDSLSIDQAQKIADKLLKNIFGAKGITKEHRTKTLFMISRGELEKLAQFAISDENNEKNKKLIQSAIKDILGQDNSLDMALFGRMVADDPSLNVDAACQVAHAISTHEVTPEFDYYTAVDDEQADDTAGAAMLGTIDYNSSTLFRYANVNVEDLVHNLGSADAAIEGIKLFIKDFMMSMPTGKQNTFANKTVPQYVMVTLRDDTPVNLVSAFEKPVISNDGYLQASICRLEEEYSKTLKFVDQPLATFVVTTGKAKIGEQQDNRHDLVDKVAVVIQKRVENENTNA
ncbi:type I-E CRISPR-associated protein Cas7/Cse4/CasC [[Lactobacillus] timonensis]|uniref:type I-E CRISPR-associated protein Cas7/Cse4/CasC n=1 Tax=[Lactobacillus] timonensis TaxID=1970790 RepID=UPI000C85E2CF